MITTLAYFVQKEFGSYPRQEQKIEAAKAAIHLFPHYKTADSDIGGIVSHLIQCFDIFFDYFFFLGRKLFIIQKQILDIYNQN